MRCIVIPDNDRRCQNNEIDFLSCVVPKRSVYFSGKEQREENSSWSQRRGENEEETDCC